MPPLKDLTNQKFGRLTVIERDTETTKKGVYWKCKCDCGNITSVRSNCLTSGDTKSCGCYYRETRQATGKKGGANGYNDLTNQQFGELIALSIVPEKRGSNNCLIWRCKCSCGREVEIPSVNLIRGRTTHCGCKTIISKGEQKINQILSNNGIHFVTQKTFKTCQYPTKTLARFDFYVNDQYLIEFDGEQHFHPKGERFPLEVYEKIHEYDLIKNQWCKNNNIPLIRIPYTLYDTLSIKDLLLESSNYII